MSEEHRRIKDGVYGRLGKISGETFSRSPIAPSDCRRMCIKQRRE